MSNEKALKRSEVYRKSHALSLTDNTQIDIVDNFPEGVIHGYEVNVYSAAVTGLGAASTTYQKLLRSFTAGSSKHRNIYSAVPGIVWDRFWTSIRGKASERTTPAAATGFSFMVYIPFAWPGTVLKPAFRPKDTAMLNLNGKAKPYLNLVLGSTPDLGTTITACTVIVEVIALYEPRPEAGVHNPANGLLSGDEAPLQLEVSSTIKGELTNPQVKLPTGLKRRCIGLAWRETDASSVELATPNIFYTDTTTPSKVEVSYGDERWLKNVKLRHLDRIMGDELGAAFPYSGFHMWLAAAGGKLSSAIDLSEGREFTLDFDNIQTSASRQLDVLTIYAKEVEPEASFAAQAK